VQLSHFSQEVKMKIAAKCLFGMIIALLAACNSGGGGGDGGGGGGTSSVPYPATYSGKAYVTLEYYNLNGQLVDTHDFTVDASVNTAAHAQEEVNPFSLRFASITPPAPFSPEGLFNIMSAASVFDSGGNFQGDLQYWDITATGNTFKGELTDVHNNPILPTPFANMITAVAGNDGLHVISVRTITKGATLTGEVNDQNMSLSVDGTLYVKPIDDLEPHFHIQINAVRMM
jgi:TfoX/Sxy family transcriptional regulator of competence genes